ncbi:MAG: NAD-dependent epimerase/dehydratase family protein [Deltaproteobacteria bacterium]|jgi:nucleoside-diphosphate-sugar epimerase|nr:NAD-dependent epimerase/dehydratase family protein [Deltaproteobacteria bacterium]MBW2531371.1 NAD-dependent epimerase/dehydratase family protein [Deltaproteobacteria bacterium]
MTDQDERAPEEPSAASDPTAEPSGEPTGAGRQVCVTGASGYIGSHLVRLLLQRGYRVRATVRDAADDTKTAHLKALDAPHHSLELVNADLLRTGSFDEAVAGCVGVFHAAASTRLNAKDPQRAIVDPAVRGTENVLGACKRAGTVERVVLTSSVAAMMGLDRPESYVTTEDDWNDEATIKQPYPYAKTLAERKAWSFQRELADEQRFELVALNPAYVLGPVLARVHLKSSPSIVRRLMTRSLPGCPRLHFNLVDVRDVALAHVHAFERFDARGRYLLVHEGRWMAELAKALAAKFPDYPVPTWPIPNLLMYAATLVDKQVTFDYLRRNLGKTTRFDGSRAPKELGFAYRPAEETIADTAQSLVDLGLLRPRKR